MNAARFGVIAAAALAFAPRAAHAQSDAGAVVAPPVEHPTSSGETSGQIALARTEYQAGVDASQAQRWPEALAHFEHAYELSARLPQILINVAGAQAQLGQLTAAVESYRRFLDAAGTLGLDAYRAVALEQLAQIEPRVAHVHVTIHGLAPRDEVSVDGAVLARAALDHELPIDPGTHRFDVARGGARIGDGSVVLADGQSTALEITVPRAPSLLPALDLRTPSPHPRVVPPITASPWFWTVVGVVGAAAIAGGIAAAVVLSEPLVQPSQGVVREPGP